MAVELFDQRERHIANAKFRPKLFHHVVRGHIYPDRLRIQPLFAFALYELQIVFIKRSMFRTQLSFPGVIVLDQFHGQILPVCQTSIDVQVQLQDFPI